MLEHSSGHRLTQEFRYFNFASPWEQRELSYNTIMGWLLNSMEPNISESFCYADSSHEMWTKIQKCLAKRTIVPIFQLKQDIVQIKQNNQPFTQYYGTTKAKWDEIDIHIP